MTEPSPERTLKLSNQLGDAIRHLNYDTINRSLQAKALPGPDDADRLVQNLAIAVRSLSQLMGQVAWRMEHLAEDPLLASDQDGQVTGEGQPLGPPAAALAFAASIRLKEAQPLLTEVYALLANAGTSHLYLKSED